MNVALIRSSCCQYGQIHALDSERMETLEDCMEVEKFIIDAYE